MEGKQQRVIWFEHLRMTDVEQVGGKNASLGEMISQLAAAGVRVPGGFATTAHAFREFLAAQRPWPSASRRASKRSTSTTCAALAAAGARSARWIADAAAAGRARRARSRDAYRALADGGPTRRSPCARRRPPRTCPTRRSRDSRKHSSTSVGSTTCSTPSSEVFASLYNDRAIAYRVHQGFAARRGRAVGRRAAHGAQRPRRRGRHVHARHRVGFRPGRVHHVVATDSARRSCRARSTPTSSTCTSRTSRPGRPAILRKIAGHQGDQDGVRRRQAAGRHVDATRRRAERGARRVSRSPTPRSKSSRATR